MPFPGMLYPPLAPPLAGSVVCVPRQRFSDRRLSMNGRCVLVPAWFLCAAPLSFLASGGGGEAPASSSSSSLLTLGIDVNCPYGLAG